MSIRTRAWAVALLAVSLVPFGCTGRPAQSDSTPPMLSWNVVDLDSDPRTDHDYTANATGEAVFGHTFRFALRGKDPEGLQAMDIGGSAAWSCSSGGVGTKPTADYAGRKDTLTPKADGTVQTEYGMILEASTKFDCPAGTTFNGGSITMIGNASNYFSGTSSGMLSLVVRVDCTDTLPEGYRC